MLTFHLEVHVKNEYFFSVFTRNHKLFETVSAIKKRRETKIKENEKIIKSLKGNFLVELITPYSEFETLYAIHTYEIK